MKEILPLLEKLQEEKGNLFRIIQDKWIVYLNGISGININVKNYAERLYPSASHFLWLEDYEEVMKRAEDTAAYVKLSVTNTVPPSEDDVKELINIAIQEINYVKRNVEDVNNKIKNIIEDKIITSIEKHIRDPF